MLGWTRKFKPVWSPESQNLTLPITKGKDQVSHDGGGATEIIKGRWSYTVHVAKVVHDSNEDNGQWFFTVKPILWGVKWFSYPLSRVKRKSCVYNHWTGPLDWTGLQDWPLDPKQHTKWWGISSRCIYLVYESFQPLIDLSSMTEINQFHQSPTFWQYKTNKIRMHAA